MGLTEIGLLVAGALALSIVATSYVVWRLVRQQSGVIQDRLDAYATRSSVDVAERKERRTIAGRLDRALRRRNYGRQLSEDLSRADVQLRISEFVMLSILAGVLGVLFGLILFDLPALALVVGFVCFLYPRIYLKQRQAKRLKDFSDQLADALRLIVSSLRSGYSMLQSLEVVASELPEPISGEFARVVREVGLGLSQEQAFNNMLGRIASDDLDMMVTAVNVQRDVGGNLAEILDTISATIEERVRIQGEIRVMTAQQTLTGYLLTFLPVAVTLILFGINRAYMMQMFEDTCGLAMLGTGVVMVGIGFVVMKSVVKIEV
ncbi:MAG: secretion system protein [Anaerolineae bacterium]|nr:secretion system protein [Anaerolineae bacterium]